MGNEERAGQKHFLCSTLHELRQLCREKGLKMNGTKQDLIDRLRDEMKEVRGNRLLSHLSTKQNSCRYVNFFQSGYTN
jgi:hypothetical protein